MELNTTGSQKLADLHIFREVPAERNQFGEVTGTKWEVCYYANYVEHYPKSRQGVTGDILATPTTEVALSYEIVWIEPHCERVDLCDSDFQDGQFALLNNKIWKVVGINNLDDCDDCFDTLRLILERITPRESYRKLKECASCFDLQLK